MFNQFVIQLTNPICNCTHEAGKTPYSWYLDSERSLHLSCPNCKTSISVPYNEFRATIVCNNLKVKLPEKTEVKSTEKSKPNLVLLDFSKIEEVDKES
jgi:hypothetical protein